MAGGATAADLVAAAQPFGLTAVTGTAGSVGMAGLTLGGGYGPLSGRFGLTLDNLLSADVVLADGSVVTVDAEQGAGDCSGPFAAAAGTSVSLPRCVYVCTPCRRCCPAWCCTPGRRQGPSWPGWQTCWPGARTS